MNHTEPTPSEPRPIRGVFVVIVGLTASVVVLALMMFDAAIGLTSVQRMLFWCLLLPLLIGPLLVARRRGVGRAGKVSLLALSGLAFLLAAFVALPAAGGHLRRVFVPWSEAPAETPSFRIVVSSKDVEATPGATVALGGYLVRIKPTGPLPESVEVHAHGEPRSIPVDPDGSFAAAVVARTGTYRFVVGSVTSDEYRIDCRNTIELLPGSALTAIPPEYARSSLKLDFPPLESSATVIAGSRCEWSLHVKGSPTKLEAKWLNPGNEAAPIRTEVRAPGVVMIAATPTASGIVGLTMKLADGSVGAWTFPVVVVPDGPPDVVAARGWRTAATLAAKPGELFEWYLKLHDDVAVSRAFVELRDEREQAPILIPLVLTGIGTHEAAGRVSFALPSTVSRIRVQLVIEDNAPTPHRVVFPATGFLEIELSPQARPLAEQRIDRDRDEWLQALAACDAYLQIAVKALDRVDSPGWLNECREQLREAEASVAGLDRDYFDGPEFAPLLRSLNATSTAARQAKVELEAASFAGDVTRTDAARSLLQLRLRDRQAANAVARSKIDGVTARRHAAAALLAELNAWPPGPWPADAGKAYRLQLQGRIAQHTDLRQAVAAESTAERSELRRRLFALETDHRRWSADVQTARVQARRRLVAGFTEDLLTLKKSSEPTRLAASDPARILGLPLPTGVWDEPIRTSFSGTRSLDMLAELEKAAAAWDQAAARMQQTIIARTDPKEALRQLDASLEDWSRRRAVKKSTPEDIAEVEGLLSFYRSFDVRKGWDDTSLVALRNRLEEQAPELSIVEASREALRLLKVEGDAAPTAEQRRAAEMTAWAEWKRELATMLRSLERKSDAMPAPIFVPVRSDLPALDRHALEQLAARANEELRESLSMDAAIALRELQRRAEAIADRPDDKRNPDDLLLDAAHKQTVVAYAFSGTLNEADRLALAARQRELNAMLASAALVSLGRTHPEVWDACRAAEDGLRLGRSTAKEELETARDGLQFVAGLRIGAVSDLAILRRLRGRIPSLTGTDARQHRQRLGEAIAELRFGSATGSKAALVTRIARGPSAATPAAERQFHEALTTLFNQADAALARCARAERTSALHGPPAADERTRLTMLSKPGRLPDPAAVQELQDVAAKLRQLRDSVGTTLDESVNNPPGTAQVAAWHALRHEADALNDTSSRLASQAVPGGTEESTLRAVLVPLQTLCELWKPIRIEQAMMRAVTVDALMATSCNLLLKAKFRASAWRGETNEPLAQVGKLLRSATDSLASGEKDRADAAVRRAAELILKDRIP